MSQKYPIFWTEVPDIQGNANKLQHREVLDMISPETGLKIDKHSKPLEHSQ